MPFYLLCFVSVFLQSLKVVSGLNVIQRGNIDNRLNEYNDDFSLGADLATPHWKYNSFVKILQGKSSGKAKFKCGGAMYAPDKVVTSAACVWQNNKNDFFSTKELFVQTEEIDHSNVVQDIQTRAVKCIRHMRQFKGHKKDGYDVALLLMESPIIPDYSHANLSLCRSRHYTQASKSDVIKYFAVGMGYTDDKGTKVKDPHAMQMWRKKTGCYLYKMTWLKDMDEYAAPEGTLQCYSAWDRCQFKYDEGSPVIIMRNDKPYCLYSIFNFNNDKCYEVRGRLIHARLDWYQLKDFYSKCDHKDATYLEKLPQVLVGNDFIDSQTFYDDMRTRQGASIGQKK